MSKRRVTQVFIALTAAFAAIGCAGAESKEASDPKTNGIRYYLPTRYFLVKPDYETGSATVTSFMGPDTSVPYAIDPWAFMAKNDSEIDFEKGTLARVSLAADTTKIASDVIGAGSELISKALEVAAAAAKLTKGPSRSESNSPPIFLFMATKEGLVQLYPAVNSQ